MRSRSARALPCPAPLHLTLVTVVLGFLAAACQPDDAEESAQADPDAPDPVASPATSDTGVGPPREDLPSSLAEQRDALRLYLDSATWQERLPATYQANQLKDTIASYYADPEHQDGAISSYDTEFFHLDESTADGGPYYIFFVTTPKMPDGFPVIVRRTSEGSQVDWECFVEFHDRHFAKFHESTEAGPRDFRVVLKRSDYWGPDRSQFTKLNDYLSYRVDLPYTDKDYYAFLPKSDPLAAAIGDTVNWGKPPLAAIVRLERVKFAHGPSHLKIVDLIAEGWHRPFSAEER